MEFLFVYPNPFTHVDRDGHPCGVCPRDPDADAGGPGQFVGARLDDKKTVILQDFGKMAPHELRSPMQSTKYSYLGIASDDPELASKLGAKDPIRLPRTKFYRDRLIEGSLLAADAATARSANVPRFVEPKDFFKRFAPPPAAQASAPTVDSDDTTEPTTSRRKAAS